MITATGAGASFCAVPSARLKPKTQISPRAVPNSRAPHQHPPACSSVTSLPPVRENAHSDPPPILQSLLQSRNISSSTTTLDLPPSVLDFGGAQWPVTYSSTFTGEHDYFGGFDSFSLRPEYHDSPSPKSSSCAESTGFASIPSPVIKPSGATPPRDDPSPFLGVQSPLPCFPCAQPPAQQSSLNLCRPQTQTNKPLAPRKLSASKPTATTANRIPATGLGISAFAGFAGGPVPGYTLFTRKTTVQHVEQVSSISDSGNMPSNNSLREICIVVVGAEGVGKSTFIQKAYDLKGPPEKNVVPSKVMTVDRASCNVKLIELDWTKLDLDTQPIVWPRAADGQRLPFVDGALILYDVTNPDSIAKLPDILDGFARAPLPVLVVSCKCDAPHRQLNPNSIEQMGIVGGYETMQTSANSPESHKKCLSAILNVVGRKNDKNTRYLNGRPRANSSATTNSRATSPRPSTAKSGHSRASSEFSSSLLKEYSETAVHGANAAQARLPRSPIAPSLGTLTIQSTTSLSCATSQVTLNSTTSLEGKKVKDSAPQITLSSISTAPFLEIVSTSPFSMQQPQVSKSSQTSGSRPSSVPSQDSDRTHNSFLEDDERDVKDPDDIPILDRDDNDDFEDPEKIEKNKGLTWDELVDQLLQQPMSRNDANFATIFLCFYRKISPPRELLKSILERFERTNKDIKVAFVRMQPQMRYCQILHQWVTEFPGDFAHPKTRAKLLKFLNSIAGNRSFSVLVNEMRETLMAGAEDDDAIWARSDTDTDTDRRDSLKSFYTTTSLSQDGVDVGFINTTSGDGGDKGLQPLRAETEPIRRVSEANSGFSVSTAGTCPLVAKGEHGSSLLKDQYDLFMSIPEEDIAVELTRMDWGEFSKIRPRDLVRHVSIPPDVKEKCESLMHVNRIISHFNHVAYWVASVILEKPKPKHRARALEKFMNIAWTLRHMNNYNSLGAVIAGINGTAVHRLALTRELVAPTVIKKFMRLELLMGTHKSHSKYRLAWENTSTARIPFLPLHRRDLVSADEGNRTFLGEGDKINWNKFMVMGDVLMVLIKSQGVPYKDLSGRNWVVEKLIGAAVESMNDDELYERSVQLENVGGVDTSKRRRGWPFQRQ
ncbi:hypothetical protein RUND412_005602 [Rhizina undulata]